MNKLLIIGAGGNGRVCAEIALLSKKYSEIAFLDDNIELKEINGYNVVGKVNQWNQFEGYEYFVSFGDNQFRCEFIKKNDFPLSTLIHPTAVISETATIDEGTVIMANAVVASNSYIGKGCIVNTASIIEHDCIVQDFVHLSPGSKIAGTCTIGVCTWIGIGANIINNISIGDNTVIGAGATVISDIGNNVIAYGIPAKEDRRK